MDFYLSTYAFGLSALGYCRTLRLLMLEYYELLHGRWEGVFNRPASLCSWENSHLLDLREIDGESWWYKGCPRCVYRKGAIYGKLITDQRVDVV